MVEHATITLQIREELKDNTIKSFKGLSDQLGGLRRLSAEVAQERELVQSLFIKLESLRSEPPGPSLPLISEFYQISQRIHSRFAQLTGFIKNTAGNQLLNLRLHVNQI